MPTNANTAIDSDWPGIPGLCEYIDLQDALNRIRGNRKILKTLFQSFLKTAYVHDLKTQLGEQNLSEAAKTVHAIKGVSANLSLAALHQSMVELETELKAGAFSGETLEKGLRNFEKTKELLLSLVEQL